MARIAFHGSFPAMSGSVSITGVGIDAAEMRWAIALGRRLYTVWEGVFSRFRPESELSRFNANGGQPASLSPLLFNLIERAVAATAFTEGRFNPFILSALERAGYDRDFALVNGLTIDHLPPEEPTHGGPPLVLMDRATRRAQLAPGARIDLGGIAKGAFVDRLASALRSWPGGCVDAGGDLFVWGVPPYGDRWLVGIEDPLRPGSDHLVAELNWSTAAVATSGTNRRRWRHALGEVSHIIDPATDLPLIGPPLTATAIGERVVDAEIAATAITISAARGEQPRAWGSSASVVSTGDGGPVPVHVQIEEPHDPPCAFVSPDALLRSA